MTASTSSPVAPEHDARPAAWLAAFGCGTVFGLGLAVAQMTQPGKVLAFLDVTGAWDPSLLFVLGAGVCVTALGYALVLRRSQPWFDTGFRLSQRSGIDGRLVLGSALFGAGWGLAGYCPGPGISSLGTLNTEAFWFVPAMLAGGLLARQLDRRRPAANEAMASQGADEASCG